jgi:LysR family transcriptional regulator, cell division regulator
MDIADLRVFEAVARAGGMNRAAVELNTVQSNITARIKSLEVDMGRPLFERRPRGVALTAAGRRLLPYAVRAMRLIADARCAVRDDGLPRGLLTIGSLETTAALRLTPLLAGYAANYPDVDFVLRTGTTRELVAATLEQSVDGAFVCAPAAQPELSEEVVFREELSLLAAPGISSLAEALGRRNARSAGCSAARRLFLSSAVGDHARASRDRGTPASGIWHAGGDLWLRRRRAWYHPSAARAAGRGLGRRPGEHPLLAAR